MHMVFRRRSEEKAFFLSLVHSSTQVPVEFRIFVHFPLLFGHCFRSKLTLRSFCSFVSVEKLARSEALIRSGATGISATGLPCGSGAEICGSLA